MEHHQPIRLILYYRIQWLTYSSSILRNTVKENLHETGASRRGLDRLTFRELVHSQKDQTYILPFSQLHQDQIHNDTE